MSSLQPGTQPVVWRPRLHGWAPPKRPVLVPAEASYLWTLGSKISQYPALVVQAVVMQQNTQPDAVLDFPLPAQQFANLMR